MPMCISQKPGASPDWPGNSVWKVCATLTEAVPGDVVGFFSQHVGYFGGFAKIPKIPFCCHSVTIPESQSLQDKWGGNPTDSAIRSGLLYQSSQFVEIDQWRSHRSGGGGAGRDSVHSEVYYFKRFISILKAFQEAEEGRTSYWRLWWTGC